MSAVSQVFLLADTFCSVLSFMKPKELGPLESVCTTWKQFVDKEWERHCQMQLGLPSKIDLQKYLPCSSYKESLKLMAPSILGDDVYRKYIGEIGPVPPIPELISLKKWNEPDPCNMDTTIGKEYVWMYCPSYIEIDREGYSLDKLDDPNDPIAPMLIRNQEMRVYTFAKKILFGSNNKKEALKVPVTINNIIELFKHPKKGNPSICSSIWGKIIEQHGNKRVLAGWHCMRRNVIDNTLTSVEQYKWALSRGIVITELVHRLLFNFLEQVRSNAYPDGQDPLICAHTSTTTFDGGIYWASCCGDGGLSGLLVNSYSTFYHGRKFVDFYGASVELSPFRTLKEIA